MPLAVGEGVQHEEEDIVVWWYLAGRPVAVGDILHFEQEKKAFGKMGIMDMLDRAKAEHLLEIPNVRIC